MESAVFLVSTKAHSLNTTTENLSQLITSLNNVLLIQNNSLFLYSLIYGYIFF